MELDTAHKEGKDKKRPQVDEDLTFRNAEILYQFSHDLSDIKDRDRLMQIILKTISSI